MKKPTAEEVEREVAGLDTLEIAALQRRWRELFKVEPPFKIRSGFLRMAIAYRLRERVFGGLKPASHRALERHAEAARVRRLQESESAGPARQPLTLSPGTRLMREWDGAIQTVEVVEDGFVWHGKTYRTLSGVAVAITGTKWSGPKFFGLNGRSGRK